MSRTCEMCPEKSPKLATVYCPADACYLCAACDHEVHSANRLASRHVRRQLVVDDITDGSSINDESDAQVPQLSSSTTTIPDDVRPSCCHSSLPTKASSTNLKKEQEQITKSQNKHQTTTEADDSSQLPSLNDVSVTFEDAAEYDFCFESLTPQMAPLVGDDDDNLFSDGKLAKSFYPDLSWDSVVTEAFEHVVPTDEAMSSSLSPSPISSPSSSSKQLVGMKYSSSSKRTCTSSSARSATDSRPVKKEEQIEMEIQPEIDDHMKIENGEEIGSTSASACKVEEKLHPSSSTSTSTEVKTEQLKFTQPCVKKSYEVNREKIGGNDSCCMSANISVEDKLKVFEQRKKRRMEALARFRSKRANRSFTKKVRYECRKQLADSRPRVKGRFVRKVEMALFHKYGALYRDHLDELKEQDKDQRIPSV